jgi:hypothetical protein
MDDAKLMKECTEIAILAPNPTEREESYDQVDVQHDFKIERKHQRHQIYASANITK